MKIKITLFLLFVGLATSAEAQKNSFTQNVTKLKVSNSLKAKAIQAFHATKDPCWDGDGPASKDCTDLKDPWEDDTFPSKPPVDTSARITAFYAFEKEIAEGQGGLVLPKNIVQDAWSQHPGFSLKSMRARLQIYNLKIDK